MKMLFNNGNRKFVVIVYEWLRGLSVSLTRMVFLMLSLSHSGRAWCKDYVVGGGTTKPRHHSPYYCALFGIHSSSPYTMAHSQTGFAP